MDLHSPAFGFYGFERKAQDVRGEEGLWVPGSVASLLRSLWVAVSMTGESRKHSQKCFEAVELEEGVCSGTDLEIVKNWI